MEGSIVNYNVGIVLTTNVIGLAPFEFTAWELEVAIVNVPKVEPVAVPQVLPSYPFNAVNNVNVYVGVLVVSSISYHVQVL